MVSTDINQSPVRKKKEKKQVTDNQMMDNKPKVKVRGKESLYTLVVGILKSFFASRDHHKVAILQFCLCPSTPPPSMRV